MASEMFDSGRDRFTVPTLYRFHLNGLMIEIPFDWVTTYKVTMEYQHMVILVPKEKRNSVFPFFFQRGGHYYLGHDWSAYLNNENMGGGIEFRTYRQANMEIIF